MWVEAELKRNTATALSLLRRAVMLDGYASVDTYASPTSVYATVSDGESKKEIALIGDAFMEDKG